MCSLGRIHALRDLSGPQGSLGDSGSLPFLWHEGQTPFSIGDMASSEHAHTGDSISCPATCLVHAAGPGAAGVLRPRLGTVLKAALDAHQPGQSVHTDGAPVGRSAGTYLLPLLLGADGRPRVLMGLCSPGNWKPGLCRGVWTPCSLEPDPAPH